MSTLGPFPEGDGHGPAPAHPPADPAGRGGEGTVVGGRYALAAPIGSGGMGAVWRATDTLLQREVAVKEIVLPPGIAPAERSALTERMLREARAAAALSHPSVIRVFDVVTDGGRPWIVMELVRARSLAEVVEQDGPLPPPSVAAVGLALLGALEAAHNAGILHRDVKPGNVLMCDDGRCVLTDFGVARSARDTQMTSPGMVLGSPQFISPERAIGAPFGPASDLFSLGVTLYTAAEGRSPFDRGDPISTMNAVVNDPPEPPRNAGQLVPVLYGLLEKNPVQRWDAHRTRTVLSGLAGSAHGVPAPRRPATVLMPTATSGSGYAAELVAPPVPPSAPPTSPASPDGRRPGVVASPGEPWRVGRAVVPTQRPGSPSPPAGLGHHPPRRPAEVRYGPGDRPSRRTTVAAWAFGGCAALVAIALVATAVALRTGGDDSSSPAGQTATAPPFPVERFRGEGVTVHVPATWKRTDARQFAQFHPPGDQTSWLRINSPRDGRRARQILRAADRNFAGGCCGLVDYRRVELREATLSGHTGAELEYTGRSSRTGQRRHGIWRMIVVDGRNYQVYMSVPENRFDKHRKVFAEAVRSMKVNG